MIFNLHIHFEVLFMTSLDCTPLLVSLTSPATPLTSTPSLFWCSLQLNSSPFIKLSQTQFIGKGEVQFERCTSIWVPRLLVIKYRKLSLFISLVQSCSLMSQLCGNWQVMQPEIVVFNLSVDPEYERVASNNPISYYQYLT